MLNMRNILFWLISLNIVSLGAQNITLPLEKSYVLSFENYQKSNLSFHSSIQPYSTALSIHDSAYNLSKTKTVSTKNIFRVYPLIDLSGFASKEHDNGVYSQAGLQVYSLIAEKLSIQMLGGYNYSNLPEYVESKIDSIQVIPSNGKYLNKSGKFYQYLNLTGNISWQAMQFAKVTVGYDKNFWGDGYRSLFLSDYSSPYPFFKTEFQAWRIKYVSLFAVLPDIDAESGSKDFKSKYGVFHYLSYNACNWLNIGFFESVIWQGEDSLGNRGVELGYLNPFLFLRPVEFSNGSPDNSMIGASLKLSVTPNMRFYGQFLLDEFRLQEIKANNGWWGNKYGFQTGVKLLNLFTIKNLFALVEYNQVHPYTYSHINSLKNYGHAYQPLAHPLGANFKEMLVYLNYSHNKYLVTAKLANATYGADKDTLNYGQNIYKSYSSRSSEYHNYIGQGIKTQQITIDLNISYIIKPEWKLRIFVGSLYLSKKIETTPYTDVYFYFGLATSIFNNDIDY
jgi:hypothetical protein